MTCPRCKGAGQVRAAGNNEPRTCSSCSGRGYLPDDTLHLTEEEREEMRRRYGR